VTSQAGITPKGGSSSLSRPFLPNTALIGVHSRNRCGVVQGRVKPVNLWCVSFQEGIAEDEVIWAYVCDEEGMGYFVSSVVNDEIDNLSYFSRFVGCPINISNVARGMELSCLDS